MTRRFFLPLLSLTLMVALAGCRKAAPAQDSAPEPRVQLTPVQFAADSAMAHVNRQCDLGPRVPGTSAHTACADYIAAQMAAYGLSVENQTFDATTWDGKKWRGRNIIGRYNADADERVVLAAHWDSRPWADADPDSSRHREPVMAANDGAAGVAVLLEVARCLPALKPQVGVDLVCFDLEDYGAPYWGEGDDEGNDWCLGSQHWSREVRRTGYKARYGILLDMVGGHDARFCYEGFSLRYARSVMVRLWETAASVGAANLFVRTEGGYVTDDHVPMNETAGIPTVDVVPHVNGAASTFGATWHTVNDTPANISKENLRLVGQTLLQMLAEEM